MDTNLHAATQKIADSGLATSCQVGLLIGRDVAPESREVASAHRQKASHVGGVEGAADGWVEAEDVFLSNGQVYPAGRAVATSDEADVVDMSTAVHGGDIGGDGYFVVDACLERPVGFSEDREGRGI